MGEGFPRLVKDLPEADIPFDGVRGWIAQGKNHQILFFEIDALAEVSEHSHDSPQWGFVIEGAMELTIEGKTKAYGKGDDYYIAAQAKHSAEFLSKSRVVDFFGEKSRYSPKLR